MRTARALFAIAIALLMVAPIVAQEKEKGRRARGTPMRRAVQMMERLREAVESLDLTDEQKEKLGKIREEQGPKMKETWEKAHEILTEEQKKAAEEAMNKAKEDGKKGVDVVDAVQTAVKLTDEQQEKMNKVGEELIALQRGMMKEVMGVLTPEQREKIQQKMRPAGGKDRKKKADA